MSKARALRAVDWAEREKRRRQMTWGAVILGILAFVAMLGYLIWQEARPIPRTGQDIPIQSRDHVAIGQPHEPYNSDPPTSGPHYGEVDLLPQAGFYNEAPLDEWLIHNLEHGYVVIWYNCSDLSEADCQTLKDRIQDVMQRAGNSSNTNTLKLIAVPRPAMDSTLALTSWGRLDKFDAFDADRILNFVHHFRDRAPEPFAP